MRRHSIAFLFLNLISFPAFAENEDCMQRLERLSQYPLHYLNAWSLEDGVAGWVTAEVEGEWKVLEWECRNGRVRMQFLKQAEANANGDNG